jgi:HK97 family phage major capsid protein
MREHIISLQRQVAEATKRLKDLVAKAEGENRDLIAEEQAAFTKDEGDVKALKARLERALAVERESASVVTPVLDPADPPKPVPQATVGDPNALAKPGVAFGRLLAGMVAGKGDPIKMAAWYKTKFGAEDIVHAALLASDATAGGLTVPQRLYAGIAPLLQARAIMRKSGVSVEPLPNGQTTVVRATGGAVFTRVAEGTEVNASSPTFGAVTLTAKKMLGLIPISNDLVSYSAERIDQVATDLAVTGIQVAEDADFLRGNGVGATPKGLRYVATTAAGNLLTMTGTPDVAKIQYDLQRMVLALAGKNVPMRNCHWGFSPRVALYLRYLLNSAGFRIFPEMDNDTLMGYPYDFSTSIPINLGGGTESENYFWDAAECLIGDAESVRVDISKEASYKDETGTLVSAFSKDQTIIRLILANDFGMFHNEGCCVMTGVTWGYTAP